MEGKCRVHTRTTDRRRDSVSRSVEELTDRWKKRRRRRGKNRKRNQKERKRVGIKKRFKRGEKGA